MKKFIFTLIATIMFAFGSINAQTQSNYAGSSKFTDNISVTAQIGTLSNLSSFYSGHTAMVPVVVIGADKYLTPWLGVGLEGRAAIGTGNSESQYQTPTALDALNFSGYAKINVLNMINFTGERRFFEPVVYTGIGWGHNTSSVVYDRNYMTYRAGVECTFNLGSQKAWAVVVNPAFVWGDIANGKLIKNHGNFELTAGVVYHFKNSNGKRTFSKAKLYDQSEIDALNARIAELQAATTTTIVEKVVEKTVVVNPVKWVAPFTHDSAELTDAGKAELDKVAQNAVVIVDAYASREPNSNEEYNVTLSQSRATVVKAYLESRGVRVEAANAHGCDDNFGRVAVVTVK